MDDWKRTEGAIWDALSSLEEDGEAGIYRGQQHEYYETSKAGLSDLTGLDFRQWWNRRVLEQLVSLGLVILRMTGDRRAAFYSLPRGMTREEFFKRKGAARYEYKLASAVTTPAPIAQAPVKASERHTQPLVTATPVQAQMLASPVLEYFRILDKIDGNTARHHALLERVAGMVISLDALKRSGNPGQREQAAKIEKLWAMYQEYRAGLRSSTSNEINNMLGIGN